MSAPTAEPARLDRRASALGLVGLGGGLLLVAGLFVWLWISRSRPIDAAQQFQGCFAVAGVPAGWTITLSQSVPGSLFEFDAEARVVHMQRSDAVPAGEPERLYFDWYDPRTGAGDVERQLDSHRAVAAEVAEKEGGTVRVDAGKLAWGAREPPFVHERFFEKGAFRDALRVNLSTPGQYCVLNMLWGWGVKASRASAERVLQLFPPRES